MLRIVGTVIGILILTWGILPLFSGVCNVGTVSLMVLGILLMCFCLRFAEASAWLHCAGSSPVRCVTVCVVAAVGIGLVLLFAVVSIGMVVAAHREPPENATVVVLGAAVRGDQPSLSLKARLDAAVAYLQEHPSACCVVSGGQGRDEACTEASVMRSYLIDHGIAAERIAVEEQATSTYENLLFSQRVIEENGWSPSIAIATQEFHQYRSQQLAKRVGFSEIGAVSASTRWDLLGGYWMRDFFGICHLYLFGE